MVVCEVCGGEDFEKHAGYLYCSICQTQSQEYFEQDYEYQPYSILRTQKTVKVESKNKTPMYDDGLWTSWEAFSHILYGMTQEVKNLQVEPDFELLVFKLWGAYLKQSKIAFISRNKEEIPKLPLNFKSRDARVLYDVDVSFISSQITKKRRKINNSMNSILNSSAASQSKRSLARHRSKVISNEYQEYLSQSTQGGSNLGDETLESLGNLSDIALSEESSDTGETLVKSYRQILTKKDYNIYKERHKCRKLLAEAKMKSTANVECMAKNKLLSIIHLALLMSGSKIQLSDLLRFIREGHISFAKVTHFLPRNVKFPKGDFSYIDVISDSVMPTSLKQRRIGGQIAKLLKVASIPTPDMRELLERYCLDLNLPEEIQKLSVKVVKICLPARTAPRLMTPLPSFEAWAVAAIIFVLKLLFGLDGVREVSLSRMARNENRMCKEGDSKKFVFEDWQKFIECRKAVLNECHYPTQEQLNRRGMSSAKKFLEVLVKESKDDFKNDRFIPYKDYFMEEELIKTLKETLQELTEPLNVFFTEFRASLTPQTCYTNFILTNLEQETDDLSSIKPFKEILKQNFRNSTVDFAVEVSTGVSRLTSNDSDHRCSCESESAKNSSFRCEICRDKTQFSSMYWTLPYPSSASGQLGKFKEEIFEKTSENFQWVMTECARMVEMNVRDVYDELLRFEHKFIKNCCF